jgi:hypothetical protein
MSKGMWAVFETVKNSQLLLPNLHKEYTYPSNPTTNAVAESQ